MDTKVIHEWPNIAVTTRYGTLADALSNSNHRTVVRMNQTHSNRWVDVSNLTRVSGEKTGINEFTVTDVDALITRGAQILVVKTADCLPAMIWHPSGYRAAIHAGRKGTELGIVKKVAKHLVSVCGSRHPFGVWFGPRICAGCYQIDPVHEIYFDLALHNTMQLDAVFGRNNYTLIDTKYCTACQNDIFFSYRKEQTPNRIFSVFYPPRVS